MPGRIRVDLEVVRGGRLFGRLQHPCTQRHDSVVGRWEVFDPQVEVDLLGRCPVGPVRGDVIGRELNADPRFAFDDDHMPVIFGIHFTVEYPRPEAALGGEIRGVEHDHLMINAHCVSLARQGAGCMRVPSLVVSGEHGRVTPVTFPERTWPASGHGTPGDGSVVPFGLALRSRRRARGRVPAVRTEVAS